MIAYSKIAFFDLKCPRGSVLGFGGNMAGKSYACGATGKPMLGLTIGQQLDAARTNWPEAIGLISCQQSIRWTFEELAYQADRLASGLLSRFVLPLPLRVKHLQQHQSGLEKQSE